MKTRRRTFSEVAELVRDEDPHDIRFVRERPRMYLHRLAQYMESSPTQRRHLIEHAKYPSPYRVDYSPATRLFGESLRLGWDEDLLTAVALQRWWGADIGSERAAFRRARAMDAVDAFSRLIERVNGELERLGARVRLASWLWLPLEFRGVKIADSPVVILERSTERITEVGVVSFHVSKSRPHSPEAMKNAAVLLWALARANRGRRGARLSPRLCVVVDVFSGQIVDAERGHKRRLWQAELACDEIAARWKEL